MANEKVREYIKNLGKSIAYSAKSTAKSQMPVLAGTISANSEVMKSGINYATGFIRQRKSGTSIVRSLVGHYMDDLEELKSNALDDLRTGKLMNTERQLNDVMKNMGMDMDIDWGDSFSDSDLDLNDDSEGDMGTSAQSVSDPIASAIRTSANVNEIGSNARTLSILDTMSSVSDASSKFISKANAKISALSMSMQAQMHTENVKLISNTNEILTSIFEFHNSVLRDHMDKQLSFFDNVLTELREIKEVTVKNSAQYNQPVNNSYRTSPIEEIFGGSSGLNLKSYGKQIKQNFENMLSMSGLGMLTALSSLGAGPLDMLKANPIGTILDLILPNMIPRSVSGAMSALDSSIGGLIGNSIMKINEAKNYSGTDKPIQSFFASLLGVDIDARDKIDVANYAKGPVQFSGKSDKALTEVIPTLLSHILAAVKGGDSSTVPLFDYRSGKFVDTKSIISANQDRIKYTIQSGMSDVRYGMRNALGKVPGGSSEKVQDEIDNFINFLATYNGTYNPLRDTDYELLKAKGLNLKDPRMYDALRAAFLSMPKSVQSSTPWKRITTKSSATQTVRSIEDELSETGLSAAYNDLNGFYANMTKRRGPGGKGPKPTEPPAGPGGSPAPGEPTPDADIENLIRTPFEAMRTTMAAFNDMDKTVKTAPSTSFFKDIIAEKSMAKRIEMIRNKIGTPGQLLTGMIGKLDNMIYRIIYGREDGKDGGGESGDSDGDAPHNSIIGKFTEVFHKAMDKSLFWLDKKVFTPFHNKFFGAQGLFNQLIWMYNPALMSASTKIGDGISNFIGNLFGMKKDGAYKDGVLSEFGNSFIDVGRAVKAMFTGRSYTNTEGRTIVNNREESIFGYMKSYSKGLMNGLKVAMFGDDKDIEIDENGNEWLSRKPGHASGLFNDILDMLKSTIGSIHGAFTGKSEDMSDENKKFMVDWSKEMKGFMPRGVATGIMGMGAGLLLPGGPVLGGILGATLGFAAHSEKFRNYLFGNEELGQTGLVPKEYVDTYKKYVPSTIAGGLLGGVGGLLLPGGPLMGMAMGATLGFVKQSASAKKFLFGDEEGKEEGVVPKKVVDAYKKYFPAAMGGGILGLLASTVVPGGAMVGIALGSMLGIAKKSTRVQEYLFGKEADAEGKGATNGLLGKEFKKRLDKIVGGGIIGGIAGMILPGGPFLGAILGSALGFASRTTKFQELIFGKKDENGNVIKKNLATRLKPFFPTIITGLLGSMGVLPGGIIGGALIGTIFSFVKKTDSFKNLIFGKTKDDEGKEHSNLITALRKRFPSIAGGILGATGLLGFGPITGIMLGAAIGFVTKSKTLQNIIFGKEDKEGNIKRGIVPMVKKFWPAIAGGILGAVGGPAGIITGALLGGTVSFISKMKTFQNFLFGKDEKDKKSGLLSRFGSGMYNVLSRTGHGIASFLTPSRKDGGPDNTTPGSGPTVDTNTSTKPAGAKNKVFSFFSGIGRAMRGFTSNIRKAVAQKIAFMSKMVENVKDQGSYDSTMLGLTHQIAVNTAGGMMGVGTGSKSGSSFMDMLGNLLKGGGLITAGMAAAALLKDIINGDTTSAVKTASRYLGTKLAQPMVNMLKKPFAYAGSAIGKGASALTDMITSSKVVRGAASGIGKLVTKAIESPAGSKVTSLITRILQHPAIAKTFGKLGSILAKNTPKIAQAVSGAIMKAGSQIAAKLLARANLFTAIGFMVYDLTTGMMDCRNIFKIPATVEPTFGMRLASGLGKLVSGQLTFGLVPASIFANIIYEIIGNDEELATLKEQQESLKNDVDVYNKQNGTSLSLDEYNDNIANKTTYNKVKGWFTGGDNPSAPLKSGWPSFLPGGQTNTGTTTGPTTPSGVIHEKNGAMNALSRLFPKIGDPITLPTSLPGMGAERAAPSTPNFMMQPTTNRSGSYGRSAILADRDMTDDELKREYGYTMTSSTSDVTVSDLRMVVQLCKQYGLNPHLWWAMVELESGYNSKAVNSIGASGWGQVIPSTGKWLYEKVLKLGTSYNHSTMGINKVTNARMSIYYLSSLIKAANGSIRTGLINYNGNELGDRYPNTVEANLKRNTGFVFRDIVNPNGTGVNTVNDDKGSSSSSGVVGFLNDMGTMLTSTMEKVFNIKLTDLPTLAQGIFETFDPFKRIGNVKGVTSAEIDKYTSKEMSKYKNVTGRVSIHDFLTSRLNKLGADYGKNVNITSGFRTDSEQQALVDQWYREHNKNPNNPNDVLERKKWVADPGISLHGLGLASDVDNPWLKSITNEELKRYGLWKPDPDEDWHIEPIETSSMERKRPALDGIFGTPMNPSLNMSAHVDSRYKFNPDIGDPDTSPMFKGAPSAEQYTTNLSTALDVFKGGKYTQFESESLKVLNLIAQGIQTLAGINEGTKELLSQYLSANPSTTSGNKSEKTVAILPIKETGADNNPFTSGATNVRKQNKINIMQAIASGSA